MMMNLQRYLQSDEFTIHPKLFLYPSAKSTIVIGNSFTKANQNRWRRESDKKQARRRTSILRRNKTIQEYQHVRMESAIERYRITS